MKRTVEENNKIADELLAEDKETLARIAVLDNAIQQKNQERIQCEKVLLNMKKRLGNVNSLKDEVLMSITAQQVSIDVIHRSKFTSGYNVRGFDHSLFTMYSVVD